MSEQMSTFRKLITVGALAGMTASGANALNPSDGSDTETHGCAVQIEHYNPNDYVTPERQVQAMSNVQFKLRVAGDTHQNFAGVSDGFQFVGPKGADLEDDPRHQASFKEHYLLLGKVNVDACKAVGGIVVVNALKTGAVFRPKVAQAPIPDSRHIGTTVPAPQPGSHTPTTYHAPPTTHISDTHPKNPSSTHTTSSLGAESNVSQTGSTVSPRFTPTTHS